MKYISLFFVLTLTIAVAGCGEGIPVKVNSPDIVKTSENMVTAAAQLANIDPLGLKLILEKNASLEKKVELLNARIKELGAVSPLEVVPFSTLKDLKLNVKVSSGQELEVHVFVNGRKTDNMNSRPNSGPDYIPERTFPMFANLTEDDVKGTGGGLFAISFEFIVPPGDGGWHVNTNLVSSALPEPFRLRYWDIARDVVRKTDDQGKPVSYGTGDVYIIAPGKEIKLYGKP